MSFPIQMECSFGDKINVEEESLQAGRGILVGTNFKGTVLNRFGQIFGGGRFQPFYEKTQLFVDAGRNIGGATLDYRINGERLVMKAIKENYPVSAELVIFDVGAHRGDYARVLTSVFESSITVYCFEPSKSLYSELEKRLRGPQFEIYQLGLGEEETSMEMFASSSNIPTVFADSFEITGEEMISCEQIKVVKLDSFCKEHKIDHIHFLKIDVEGFEMSVLKGAKQMIDNDKVDFIQFEFGQHSISSRTFMKDFFDLLMPKYRIYLVLRGGISEMKAYSPKFERFVSATNYLAISRRMTV